MPNKVPVGGGVGSDVGSSLQVLPSSASSGSPVSAEWGIGDVVEGGIKKEGDLVEAACAVAGIIAENGRVD